METSQQRLTFTGGMNKDGFRGFIKQEQNNQTIYVFLYETPK